MVVLAHILSPLEGQLEANRQDIQREPSSVWLGIGRESHLEHRLRQRIIEVETVLKGLDDDVFSQIQAVTVQETVVCQSVHHWARASCCWMVSEGRFCFSQWIACG